MSVQIDLLYPLILFCLATLFTPGPNNLMLMTSGLNFGLRRTLPHLFGVDLGFAFLVFCTGVGLGGLFKMFPSAYIILKYAGAAYMLYLAYVIAMSDPHAPKANARKKPFTFVQAAAFQWVNAKAWIMAVGAISTYAPVAPYPYNAALIAGIFGLFGAASSFSWASFGLAMQRFLKHPKIIRAFNLGMALLLIVSILPIFWE